MNQQLVCSTNTGNKLVKGREKLWRNEVKLTVHLGSKAADRVDVQMQGSLLHPSCPRPDTDWFPVSSVPTERLRMTTANNNTWRICWKRKRKLKNYFVTNYCPDKHSYSLPVYKVISNKTHYLQHHFSKWRRLSQDFQWPSTSQEACFGDRHSCSSRAHKCCETNRNRRLWCSYHHLAYNNNIFIMLNCYCFNFYQHSTEKQGGCFQQNLFVDLSVCQHDTV